MSGRGALGKRIKQTAFVPANTFARPMITDITPTIGPADTVQSLAINGSGFSHPAGDAYAVKYSTGGDPYTDVLSFTVDSDTQITAQVDLPQGTYNVRVFGPGGQSTIGDAFETTLATISNIAPALGNDRGGTSVTITGTGFTGSLGGTLGGVALTNFTVVNDTTITAKTGAHARGVVDLTIDSVTLAAAYEYLDFASVSGVELAYRADLGVTLTGSLVESIANQSGSADTNRNIVTPNPGSRPTYFSSHANFNNRPAWGTDPGLDQERQLRSGLFAASIARSYTTYHVLRIPSGAAAKDIYFRISNTGSSTNSALLYGRVGANAMKAGDGTSETSFTISADTTYILCIVYKAAGGCDIYINKYDTTSASGGAGTQVLAGLSTGTFTPDFTQYIQSEILVYSGAHNSATRQKIAKDYLGDAYGVTVIA